MATTLELVLLYLAAAVTGVVGCRSLRLPPVLGYLVAGVVIGPNTMALAKDSSGLHNLAEFGVVFLMFVIGLEFNLPRLRAMKTLVFGLGASQVLLTVLGAMLGNLALIGLFAMLGRRWDLTWQGAAVLGSAMAMSSTALVIKLMAERLEIESEHGRRVIGVLLFQDLAVVPLLVLIPALGGSAGDLLHTLGPALLKAAASAMLPTTAATTVLTTWLEPRPKTSRCMLFNFGRLNSRPITNIRNTTPNSAR